MMKSSKNKGTAATVAPESAVRIKFSLKSAGKYLRELSVVVIGIAITLGVSSRLTVRNETKDMTRYMEMVRMELEALMQNVNRWTNQAEEAVGYSGYLLRTDRTALNPDTLQHYAAHCYNIVSFPSVTNAFDMFKASGSMRLVKDEDLLLRIWSAYSWLDNMKNQVDNFYNNEKKEATKKEIAEKKAGKNPVAPLYDFYTYDEGGYTYSLLHTCRQTKAVLEETIAKIEKGF